MKIYNLKQEQSKANIQLISYDIITENKVIKKYETRRYLCKEHREVYNMLECIKDAEKYNIIKKLSDHIYYGENFNDAMECIK